MRARVLAFVILLILLGIPSLLYWYFFSKQTSSFRVETNISSQIHVELQGTISDSFLPLADKFLVFQKDCLGVCEFSSIPPVEYKISVTAPGMIDMHDTQKVHPGESKKASYILHPELVVHESIENTLPDETLAASLIENANTTLSGAYSFVGIVSSNRVYALRKIYGQQQLGLVFPDKFIPIRDIPDSVLGVSLDRTRRYFLITFPDSKVLAISTEMDSEVEISLLPDSLVQFDDKTWKIGTFHGVYMFDGKRLQENIRFTDFLDVSSSVRIGYIAASDKKKLQLSNFPPNESVLVFLDRTTGESYVLKKGISIQVLYLDANKNPVYMDEAGKVWEISLPTKE